MLRYCDWTTGISRILQDPSILLRWDCLHASRIDLAILRGATTQNCSDKDDCHLPSCFYHQQLLKEDRVKSVVCGRSWSLHVCYWVLRLSTIRQAVQLRQLNDFQCRDPWLLLDHWGHLDCLLSYLQSHAGSSEIRRLTFLSRRDGPLGMALDRHSVSLTWRI